MKTPGLFLLLTSLTFFSKAQSTGGFFDQQATKEKIQTQQLVDIEVQLQEVKNGYHITETGINTIHDLKGGTFALHEAYFSSLQQVSPAVQSNPKAKAIAGLQQQVILAFSREVSWQRQQKLLNADEISYIQAVYANLQKKMLEDRNELKQVLTPGHLQMTDHDRLERIDQLYESTQDKLAFTGSFTSKCRQLATSRRQNKQSNDQLKKLYGIN